MGSGEAAIVAHQVDMLRRDGSATAKCDSAEEAATWRAAMRRACRAAGLRIRTSAANSGDHWTAWAVHLDHVVTEAEERATRRALEAAYNDEPIAPFPDLVREEQRKLLRVVRDEGVE